MTQSWLRMKRTLVLLALGGATLGLFGDAGCLYPYNADYFNLFKASGNAVIQSVSDNVFANIGKDYNTIVRTPTTTFAQAVWSNWLDSRIPDDLPTNTVVQR
jgi:hypothetical protein